ncbi:MAG: hypothetical protein BRD30_02210, partial [Bacteroidetes bacterium QH_2_63_10]
MHFPGLPDFLSESTDSSRSAARQLTRRLSAVVLSALALLLLTVSAQLYTGQSQALPGVPFFDVASSSTSEEPPSDASSAPALTDLPTHPSTKLAPYFSPSAPASAVPTPSVLRKFHDLLDQYVLRQTEDDNFTIRVIDRRSNEVLEVFELTKLRSAYRRGTEMDWEAVDERRYKAMERLVDKYEQQGVPLDDIIVRWGRSNQVKEAHERGRPYQAYERRLAESLGLSLLATEIGTVETFNQ